MGQNQHEAESPQTRNQNNAMSEDPEDGHRLTDNPKKVEKSAAEKVPPHDQQNQATIEEFGQEGLGLAPKE